jgi:hypothetical protein
MIGDEATLTSMARQQSPRTRKNDKRGLDIVPKGIMETFLYNPGLAREQAAEEIRAAKDLAARCEEAYRVAHKERDEMEKRMRDMEVETQRTIKNLEWASVQKSTEYEDKIAMLEDIIAKEREDHRRDTQCHMDMQQQVRNEAELRVRELEAQHGQALEASVARAKDAEERLEIALRNTENELTVRRNREEVRVKETRDKAEARLREHEEQKRFELQQIHGHVANRQKAMEETLVLNGRQKSEAVSEARRHAAALTTQMEEYMGACSSEQAIMDLRCTETLLKQKQYHEESMNQQKGLVELERSLHHKTMERTMARVLGLREGADSPTAGVHQNMLARLPAAPPTSLAPTAGPGNPLARAGGSVLA